MKKNIKLILLSICFPFGLMAQELINSQFYLNRVNTNPAFVGELSGSRINLNSRMQWRNVPSDPNRVFGNFTVANVSFDKPLCSFGQNAGIGIRASQENHGQAGLQTSAAYGAYSYSLRFSTLRGRSKLSKLKSTLSSVRFGLEFGFLQRSVNNGNLIYSDQIDPVRGVVAPSANSNLPLVSKLSFNSTAGLIISWNLTKYRSTPFKKLYTGYAVHNLLMPSVNIISSNSDERLARRHTLHTTAMFDNKWPVALLLHGRYMWLESYKTNVTDIFVNGVKNGGARASIHPTLGVGLRIASTSFTKNSHAMLAAMGFTWGNGNQFMISGDMNAGGFSNGSVSTWELSLIFNFENGCKSNRSRGAKTKSFLGCADL